MDPGLGGLRESGFHPLRYNPTQPSPYLVQTEAQNTISGYRLLAKVLRISQICTFQTSDLIKVMTNVVERIL